MSKAQCQGSCDHDFEMYAYHTWSGSTAGDTTESVGRLHYKCAYAQHIQVCIILSVIFVLDAIFVKP